MIEVVNLTKRYGAKTAVDDVSFTVQSGKVTGFLGPNGAGKSTSMRVIMGLDAPTSGQALIHGHPYAALTSPLTTVGALLDAKGVHKGRSARNHLRALAATHGIPRSRVEEVIGLTGLDSVAGKRVGGFSLGMGQRLGIAAALLGDPEILILDEPVNGLDPEGVLWVRNLARTFAAEGRTVFLSSHLMSEVAQTADHVIVIGQGRIIADQPLDAVLAGVTQRSVRVRSPQLPQLVAALVAHGWQTSPLPDGAASVTGATTEEVGEAAARGGFTLYELTPQGSTLEEAYMELTHDSVEYRTDSARAHSAGSSGPDTGQHGVAQAAGESAPVPGAVPVRSDAASRGGAPASAGPWTAPTQEGDAR